jgi:hypothetical protein
MSTDLERELRDLLSAEAGSAPPPHEAGRAIRRTRRRQTFTALSAVAGIAAVVVAATAGLRLLDGTPDSTPAAPTRTETMNGVGITIPQGWVLIDPDEAGFNGPSNLAAPDLPRMVLALAPFDPGELFGCPGVATSPHTFLLTVQERPLANAGPDATPWPAELETLDVGAEESACYPGWAFQRAGWTSAGRTFEARVGYAPNVTDADREALLVAFASLTFEPAEAPATSVVIGTGQAGGEPWELIATRGAEGLELSLQGESWGGGVGGFDPEHWTLHFVEHVLGEGADAERIAFSAIPVEAVTIEVEADDPSFHADVHRLDVPDEIDASFDVLVIESPPGTTAELSLLDADGELVARGPIGAGDAGSDGGGSDGEVPTEPATPPPSTPIEHGGTYWGLYLGVAADTGDLTLVEWVEQAEAAGYTTGPGELACDDGSAEGLGVPADWFGVAVYFATREDAEAAAGWFATNVGEPHGIARVTTYCLD